MKISDLAIEHDYYANDGNYYNKDAHGYYDSWREFYTSYKDADIDMNLAIRWDIYKCNGTKDEYYMQIIIILQRKGIYMPIVIGQVTDEDVPQIIEFLKPHYEKLISIWQPISGLLNTRG